MTNGSLLTRFRGVDVLSWNPVRPVKGASSARLVNNFGDLLGPLLVEKILNSQKMRRASADETTTPVLVAVGSVLHFAPPGAVVWGTGVNFKLAEKLPTHLESLDIRSVRGPYSARIIVANGGNTPTVFGDPALLLPRYMPELKTWSSVGAGSLLVAPNLNDFESMSASAASGGHAVVDPTEPLNFVLRTIAESGFVVGSSLHAIAIADALGIPARFVASSAEGVYKYRDYLAGTGRPLTRIASDIEDAIAMSGHAVPDFDIDAVSSCFPRDLWGVERGSHDPESFDDRESIIAAWRAGDAARVPDVAECEHRLLQEIFPKVVSAAQAEIDQNFLTSETVTDSGFAECFDEAYAFRVALAAGVSHDQLSASDRRLMVALDSGRPDRFLRALWLNREGPHAVMRAVRSAEGLHVFSIALRPGSLTNDLATIRVVCRDEDGRDHVATLPVFEMYHHQWSIDLSAFVDLEPGAGITSVVVRISDQSGLASEVPVLRAPYELTRLSEYPRISGAFQRWQRVSEVQSQEPVGAT